MLIAGQHPVGDTISPTLFACFVNCLSQEIKALNLGIKITNNNNNNNVNNNNNNNNDITISNLLYADDIVMLAETENDLQEMINTVYTWCSKWRMEINLDKTNILHIRKKSQRKSDFVFKFGRNNVIYCQSYKYLGLTINEHLDFKFSTDILSESGGRAMSSIITKMIKKGISYECVQELV